MKQILLSIFLLSLSLFAEGQQGMAINAAGTPADANAMLDINATNKGILIPRVNYNNRPLTPTTGLLIFVTANGPQGNNAFYYYNGSAWVNLRNYDDVQNLALSHDTLFITQGNNVPLNSIFSMIGFANCGSGYINVGSDINNCGTCGNVCALPSVSANGCSGGSCYIITCNVGFANCNGVTSDGCEINTTNDASNCGACGNVCALWNATSACSGSSCYITSCIGTNRNCDGFQSNGCETNIFSSNSNCGSCGSVCSLPNATSTWCNSGWCDVLSCSSGFGNCDGWGGNGCELNLSSSYLNCGSCGYRCTFGVHTYCSGGVCY